MAQDIEKNVYLAENTSPVLLPDEEPRDNDDAFSAWIERFFSRWTAIERKLARSNVEPRGIQRVLPHERHSLTTLGYEHVVVFFFGSGLAANNLILGMLAGPVYNLSFLDASLCAVFGTILGSLGAAYTSCFSVKSGNRVMVFARYSMGWWPGKLVVVFTLLNLLGYSVVNVVAAAQILSAMTSHGSLSLAVGVVIVAVVTWFVTTFGYCLLHIWEHYQWIPQLIALSILAGVAGPHFQLTTSSASALSARALAGQRLSFFSLCYSSCISYVSNVGDYFVYYPTTTSRWKFSLSLLFGLVPGTTMVFILGIGLTSDLQSNAMYLAAWNSKNAQGALIVEALRPLGYSFSTFLAIIIFLGLVSNTMLGCYSIGLDFQTLGQPFLKVPRMLWGTVGIIIWMVCGIAGREHLSTIFSNFLALIGYWFTIWVVIVIEEHLVFRRSGWWRRQDDNEKKGLGWDWTAWNSAGRLPLGIAATISLLIGFALSVLCMTQVYFVGPIATAAFGSEGGDLGNWIGGVTTAVLFPPLRFWELRKFRR